MSNNIDFLSLVEEYRPQVREVDISYVKDKMDNNDEFILIDVREDHEWNQGHLPDAIHISRGTLEHNIGNLVNDKTRPIILYCGVGFRSILAAHALQEIGYSNVVSMNGGIRDWLTSGYKIEI